jgi:DNA polymerase-3 subunit delta
MNYKLALNQAGKGQVKSVYVCYGHEKYLIREFIDGLTQELIEQEHVDFAVSRFDLTETSIEAVIEDVETLPFMVPRKLVIANHAHFFTAAKEGTKASKVEHSIERLMEYMQSPVDYTVLVLVVQADKLDERKKLVKWAKELACVIPFTALTSNDLAIWISAQTQKLKCRMDDKAVEALILNAGTDLQALSAEITKLSLYAGTGGEITPSMIEELVVRNTEQNVFKLIEEMAQLNLDQALSILNDLLKQREEPIKILMLIARQFRIIIQVKELSARSYSQQQIATQLKLHPYAVKIAEDQGRRYSGKQLIHIQSQLAELDYGMKTGRIEKVMGLEMFLLKLVG